ncbi:hypothetical protein SscP1EGY_7 [Streptomyces phage SscP1EGY]|nr:hypothetical protein SscP1EGY_7 [Streptomyces phage SscP1EGY]
MSNEPIFQQLVNEYAAAGKSYERMTTPYMSPVRPLGTAKQPLMDTPVYGPNEYLDGPYKAPLPKRNLAQLIKLPETDPEITKRFQEFITTAPMAVIKTPRPDLIAAQLEFYKGMVPKMAIVDEMQWFQKTDLVDPNIQYEIDKEAVKSSQPTVTYDEMVEVANKYQGVVLEKIITVQELVDGRTSADIIEELGLEFVEKYPTAAVSEVNVGEKLNGDMVVTVRGSLISKEDETSTPTNPKQTDESVNAASNEETDEDDEPVILTPNFWKISDEE